MNWQARLEQQPSLWDIQNWPVVEVLSVPANKRHQYWRNQCIVNKVLAQVPLKHIEAEFRFAKGRLTHLMNRCLAGDSEDQPPLTKALIPGCRVRHGQRLAPLASFDIPSGSAFAFEHLLETAPGLRLYLEKLLKKFANRARKSQNLRVNTFHKAFIRYLRQVHWPTNCYPFTAQNLGYQGARRYFHKRLAELRLPTPPKRTLLPSARPIGIFEELEIDEHILDGETSVVMEIHKQWEPLRVSRISLIACRDVASNTVIARQLVLSKNVCKSDMLMLFAQIATVWQPSDLRSPGLVWPTKSYMPTQLGEAFLRPTIGVIRLDNALVHLANDVRDHVCSILGATLNLGLPRYPTARVLIESAFKDLNLTSHRLPSTTGSHPTDPLKEPTRHRKQAPTVSLKTLEEMIDLHIATMNTRLMGNIGAQSPMQVMTNQMANHLVPLRPYCILGQDNPKLLRETVTVKFEKGVRREPWINFMYQRYCSPGVLTADFIGKAIVIQYDLDAISRVRAYSQEGDYLGVLSAPKTWLRFEHSIVTRKYIMRLVNAEKMRGDDPFGEYYDYLLAHRDLPSCALEIVRFGRELYVSRDRVRAEPESTALPVPHERRTKKSSVSRIPDWNEVFQSNRGPSDGK